ncbi:MAG: glycyl radical protein [Erysipelotrichaceae bacterium]|nr:glycyl radical protein [Erysipelotrichaceae bacterium]
MENKEHFGSLTPRMQRYRDAVLEKKPYIDATRALLATESYQENLNQPAVIKRAKMLEKILDNMPIYIEGESALFGSQASSNKDAPIFPEYTMKFVLDELDLLEKRDGDVFYITEETKKQLRSIAGFWENNNLRARGEALIPEEMQVYMDTGFFGMEGKLNAGDAHIVVDYEHLLKAGLKEYEERTLKYKAGLDLTRPESIRKYHFYNAVLIVIEAVKNFALRYSRLAAQLAEKAEGPRRQELLKMSEMARRIPYEPVQSFHEAVQAVWFIQCVLQIESNGHSLSYGRFDQYAWPYLKADLEAGTITEEEAVELLTNLWVKTLTVNKVRSQAHTFSSAGSPMYQNVTVGGQTAEGKDAVNPLSFLVLKSVAQTRLPQPNLTVRYHRHIDQAFMNEALEVLKLGTGMPAFNSDEVIIPSFMEKGVAREDAYNYSAVGCVETAVPGKWGYRCTGMSYLNFPRILLMVMNNGVDVTSGRQFVKGYGTFEDFETWDDLMKAWDLTIRELTRASVIVENAVDLASEAEVPDILCSALTQDCLGRGKTIKEGGAVYDFISGLQVGIADMADSLAALKKLVYEEGKISRSELMEALQENFQSEKGQQIRRMLLEEAPKYGNDIDYVDELIVEAYGSYIDEMKKYPNTRCGRGPIGGIRYAGTSSISANVGQGMGTMATPNGRYAHAPLAEGSSPAHSMDTSGPTAVFKSVSKLPTHEITGGVLLNQKVTPALLSTPENMKKLEMLIRTFFNRLDGYHVQYNVVDKATLLDAQAHPENYKDLIVRVAGYSAFFNVLSKATQDDIIGRTEQTL